jgi:hypothetical protein
MECRATHRDEFIVHALRVRKTCHCAIATSHYLTECTSHGHELAMQLIIHSSWVQDDSLSVKSPNSCSGRLSLRCFGYLMCIRHLKRWTLNRASLFTRCGTSRSSALSSSVSRQSMTPYVGHRRDSFQDPQRQIGFTKSWIIPYSGRVCVSVRSTLSSTKFMA